MIGERSRVVEFLLKTFEEKPAFISKIRRILLIILSLHISSLFRRGFENIYIRDLWGLLSGGIESPYIGEEDLKRVILGDGEPQIMISTSESIKRKLLAGSEIVGLYTDGGASIARSMGFKPVIIIRSSIKSYNYILQDLLSNQIIFFRVSEKGFIQDLYLPQRTLDALEVLSRAFETYGSYRFNDAVRILMRELGLDRIEAQKVLRELYERGIIRIERGGFITVHTASEIS
ncbi:MAG: hypothetical protein ABWJ42_03445 [Sulfolobales archaeon]